MQTLNNSSALGDFFTELTREKLLGDGRFETTPNRRFEIIDTDLYKLLL